MFFKRSSAEQSMKGQLLINVEIVVISGKFKFKTQNLVIYPAYKTFYMYNLGTRT